jgi:hypothetical protein
MTPSVRFSTALRPHVRNKMEQLGDVDLDTMIPLYYARVASLVNELRDKSTEEAEIFF